ncbi:MAG: 50S ribosomal protein L4 [Candidatus Helarchaeota archaeon]
MPQKVNVYDLKGKSVKTINLPEVFETPFRPDIINRAVIALQSHRFQPQGVNRKAGQRNTAESVGPGRGISRVPRIKGGGTPAAQQGAFAPGTRGGRQAHPPRPEKNLRKEINKKERILAIRSAIAATAKKERIIRRGHKIDELIEIPTILTDEFETLKKSSEVREVFENIGAIPDLIRASVKKIRPGKGKMRNRKYKKKKSLLIVVSKNGGIFQAARNFPGVDICEVKNLNAELLAPGGLCGRLTLWSESAISQLSSLFS